MDSKRTTEDFINETIKTTPRPQASSTIEKKRISKSKKREEMTEKQYVPVLKDFDEESEASSCLSSLGIMSLDQDDDFSLIPPEEEKKESELMMPHPDESITNRLLKQRELARKAIERANNLTEKKVSGLPSYLLKPNQINSFNSTPLMKDESTVNASDLERLGEKISFETKEISARSSSIGNMSEYNSSFSLTG